MFDTTIEVTITGVQVRKSKLKITENMQHCMKETKWVKTRNSSKQGK